ncbi:MAG: hypothetical protein Q4A21_03050 [bacterium]|nr:hypothetical protein [bacterium]
MRTVVKKSGQIEEFSLKKLEKSLHETFNIVKLPDGELETLTKKILAEFQLWQSDKPEITTADIRRKITQITEKIHPEASYIYDNFKKIL